MKTLGCCTISSQDPDADTLSGKSEEEEDDTEKKEGVPVRSKQKKGVVDSEEGKNKKDNEDDNDEPATSGADTSADSQDWEAVTVDMELWEVLARQCEDALEIATLLNIQASEDGSQHQPITVSVSRLLHGGKGESQLLCALACELWLDLFLSYIPFSICLLVCFGSL